MNNLNTLKVKFIGDKGLILHNGQLVDPTNPIVIDQKKITAKGKKKTDADLIELARLEWLGGLYLSESKRICIPSDNIERCIQQGAQKLRMGPEVKAGMWLEESEIEIECPFINGQTLEQLYKDKRFVHKKSVAITTSRVIRVRPIIPAWSISFTLVFDDEITSERNLKDAIDKAGLLVGLGDWRPKFGRFHAEYPE